MNGPFYFVHYKGWKQRFVRTDCSWDEWVPQDRIMKHTPENLVKQQQLRTADPLAKKHVKITEKKPTAQNLQKRRRDSTAEKVSLGKIMEGGGFCHASRGQDYHPRGSQDSAWYIESYF